MFRLKKTIIISILFSLMSYHANANEFSANIATATDYVFRGISQADESATIQGGLDLKFTNGLYVGTWASNVDFGGDENAEIDLYTGYAWTLDNDLEINTGIIFYTYSGASELNYQELFFSVSASNLTLGVNYTDEFGDGGPNFYYPYFDYSFELPATLSLGLHFGYTKTNESAVFDTDDDYIDWSIGISKEHKSFAFGLTYSATDIDDLKIADDRVVFSVTYSM